MSPRRCDGAERLLALATIGLPPRRAEWGAAVRAELASIDDPDERRSFARSVAAIAFARGLGIRIGLPLFTGITVAAIALTASRLQLADAGPGIMSVTVPVPALLILLAAALSSGFTRSFRIGVETGAAALLAGFCAVFAVVAAEGLVWMERLGVFVLDGDAPRGVVGAGDVIFDIFSTGIWAGHLIFWLPGILFGAALGARIGARRDAVAVAGARAVRSEHD